ncbi:glycosyltransferase family 4 protein [Xanthomarina sp. F1114]|uniref:glycosyltransferase family 4 protein n=1 Tax=Xanthomarina sp. F1114 TaxID=2996019 RepID=UPI00225E3229|nr:glycosyltransferase family 4 protein [Xanthomarina sp. F1114]MCX7548867.1 glycosyltransferase family 4 protein [Xanthomarina sp. F1114]
MNNKILFVATIHKHFRAFHIPYIEYLKSKGHEVHVAANDGVTRVEEADKQFDIPINRNPFSLDNVKAIKELRTIIDRENYSLIHCHTAMGSVVARLAAKGFRKKGLKVLYTAHGFHFYKGSSLKNWLLFYPVEKYLSTYTDGIITINQEDYNLMDKKKFRNEHSFLTSGVGINTGRLDNINETISELRSKNNYKSTDFLLLYIAEFIERKNHEFVVNHAIELKEAMPNIKILFAGRGKNLEVFKQLVKDKNISDTVHVLGFRTDMGELIKMIDVGISVSGQEGLPMNVAEQLYMGKPVVATKIRGHIDLIEHEVNGLLFEYGDFVGFKDCLLKLYSDKNLYDKMSESARIKSQDYILDNCIIQMSEIYKKLLPN